MKISIIIPVHNGEQTVARCVESFGEHDPSQLEILLVENNSSDRSWEVCQALSRIYPTVTCVQAAQSGVSAARNVGLRMASGQVIGFLDADDAVREDLLTIVQDAFSRHTDCDALCIGFEKVFPDGRRIRYSLRKSKKLQFEQMIPSVLCDHNVSGYVWNKFWRAEVLDGVFFREDLSQSEDTHFVINALTSFPERKVYIDKVVPYQYIQGEDSATAQVQEMFSDTGQLKLIEAVYGILGDFPLKGYHRLLSKRLMFAMASSQYLRFRKQLHSDQRSALKRDMRKNVLWYGVTFFVAPMETVKCFLRLMLSCFR